MFSLGFAEILVLATCFGLPIGAAVIAACVWFFTDRSKSPDDRDSSDES